jgi:hypothetical protein
LLVKNVFSREEIEHLRDRAYQVMEENKKKGTNVEISETRCWVHVDLLSTPGLRQVVLDDGVLHIMRRLLGERPVYFGDSRFAIGTHAGGARSWHKDLPAEDQYKVRENPSWDGRYTVLRCALYLQDHAKHSGGLGIKRGSHAKRNRLLWFGRRFPVAHGRGIFVNSEVGDLVVWTLRTTHSGYSVRAKCAPDVRLHPKIENLLPSWLQVPEERERVVLFSTFGIGDQHMDRIIGDLKLRELNLKTWRSARFGQDVWDQIARKDLGVIQVLPEYGTPEPHPIS